MLIMQKKKEKNGVKSTEKKFFMTLKSGKAESNASVKLSQSHAQSHLC